MGRHVGVTVASDRQSHWIRANQQCRIPKRWIAFDTESRAVVRGKESVQTWRIGAAVRWRHGLKTGDHVERGIFARPRDLVAWIDEYCVKGHRTVAYAHNLGYDVRIAQLLTLLPEFGWELDWMNLDRSVSVMTWRSDHGTLVFADTYTWIPASLAAISAMTGSAKLGMPRPTASDEAWGKYCLRDAEVVYHAVSTIVSFIATRDLGNWQPTGAGMAYTMWRHKFMRHKVLVHDDVDALDAERAAMHTGRAEAWKHGTIYGRKWVELDMRNAYLTIASESDMPCKLKFKTGAISVSQYKSGRPYYRINATCVVYTSSPVVPYYTGTRTVWPVGRFTTVLWDTEIDALLDSGAEVKITSARYYTRAPILATWGQWILEQLTADPQDVPGVVQMWLKHCGRALIGRIALRVARWELYGANPQAFTGVTHTTDPDTGQTHRMLHVGDRTLVESSREEGRDSLPQVTGWIMARCRALLWEAMCAAGLPEVLHVDTDSLIVSAAGVAALRRRYGPGLDDRWQVKGAWRRIDIQGPRNYRTPTRRALSGIPVKAAETERDVFEGERWHSLAADIEHGRPFAVTIEQATWHRSMKDPRRLDVPGADHETMPIIVGGDDYMVSGSSAKSGTGA